MNMRQEKNGVKKRVSPQENRGSYSESSPFSSESDKDIQEVKPTTPPMDFMKDEDEIPFDDDEKPMILDPPRFDFNSRPPLEQNWSKDYENDPHWGPIWDSLQNETEWP